MDVKQLVRTVYGAYELRWIPSLEDRHAIAAFILHDPGSTEQNQYYGEHSSPEMVATEYLG